MYHLISIMSDNDDVYVDTVTSTIVKRPWFHPTFEGGTVKKTKLFTVTPIPAISYPNAAESKPIQNSMTTSVTSSNFPETTKKEQ